MSRKPIFLVGHMKTHISGGKLPSNRDCLSVLFYNMRVVNLDLHKSASLVIDECLIFWMKARIPTQLRVNCIIKCKKLYETLRKLQKHQNRTSAFNKNKENEFEESLNDLFDIAHADALILMKINEDKEFLIAQRKKGRHGCMLAVDMKRTMCESKRLENEEKEHQRRKKQQSNFDSVNNFELDSDSSDSNKSGDNSDMIVETSNQLPGTSSSNTNVSIDSESPKMKRAKKEIMSPRLCAVLDKCKISDRDSVHLLTAFLDAIFMDPGEYIINRTSIKIAREKFRKQICTNMKSNFDNLNVESLVVHWDSKILPDITGKLKVDRLPIVVTGLNVEQLLGVPELSSGTGFEISSAVYDTLQEWSLLEKIQAFVFDTTASNTGRMNGACHLLEQKLGRDVIYLACRHHIYEVVLQGVFSEIKLVTSTGPDIILFKKFREEWQNFNQNSFLIWSTDENVKTILIDDVDEIIIFAKTKINENLPRDDYKEFLELIIIFLGGIPSRGIHFRTPGAYHHARWMAKAMYCLKIFLFRKQFIITQREENALKRICCFIIKCYAKTWFSAPNAITAPLNDIYFLRKLEAYKKYDKEIAEKAITKILNHLWYLSDECAAFSIFDERLTNHMRRLMANKILLEEEYTDAQKKKKILKVKDFNYFLQKQLPLDLLSGNSKKVFERFKIPTEFLKFDPEIWNNLEDYQYGKQIIMSLKVVNDTAERGVKLIEEFNDKFTRNEEQKQFVLQVVQDYRKRYPGLDKNTLKIEYGQQ